MNTDTKWDQRFLKLAIEIATWSKDQSTQVGSVIIGKHRKPVSFGYNGFPRGVNDDIKCRHERPNKYFYFEHAERNAIYNADQDLEGCTLYVTHFPCADCTRAIIQNQIARVVVDATNGVSGPWAQKNPESIEASVEMLNEVGITVTEI